MSESEFKVPDTLEGFDVKGAEEIDIDRARVNGMLLLINLMQLQNVPIGWGRMLGDYVPAHVCNVARAFFTPNVTHTQMHELIDGFVNMYAVVRMMLDTDPSYRADGDRQSALYRDMLLPYLNGEEPR